MEQVIIQYYSLKSFLNGKNSVFFEYDSGKTIEHAGMICLGETIKGENESVFKDLYKVFMMERNYYT